MVCAFLCRFALSPSILLNDCCVHKLFFCTRHFICSTRNTYVTSAKKGAKQVGDNYDILDNVFENFIKGPTIFRNRDVLRHDYLPDRLPHREEQIRLLGSTVAPVLKDFRCSNVFIYGKTGTGKTAVTKYVLSHLESKAKEHGARIKFSYVNCRMTGSAYRIFAGLCQTLGVSVPFTGLSVGEVFERFRNGLESARIMLIVALDEVDSLIKNQGDSLLYELTRINESLQHGKVALIGISNDLRLKEFLDPRVFSSLSEEELVFRPYDAGELRGILLERSALSFREGALSDSALNVCSAMAAAEHGDARRALDLLRVAGEVAEREGAKLITEEHVREAEKRIEHNRVMDAVKNLTLHSKLVLLSVFRLGRSTATTGEIYDVYNELCSKLGTGLLTQRRLGTLVSELDAMGLLNAKIVNMGRYGRTKKIRLEVARSLLRDMFASDVRLSELLDH